MIKLFAGYDSRESIGFHVFTDSVLEHSTGPVCVIALDGKGLPQGSNAFTYSRFLVPFLCEFRGRAIFADGSDMLMLGDVAELDALFDPRFAVQVVKHDNYNTAHPIKYRGTAMECPNRNYERKQWASLMLFNCEHPYWRVLAPGMIASCASLPLLQFAGLDAEAIGALPDAWNRIVDEGQAVEGAKLLHWTAGIPGFAAYADSPGAAAWFSVRDRMLEAA